MEWHAYQRVPGKPEIMMHETVRASLFETDFRRLQDFAVFALGMNRQQFTETCSVTIDADAKRYADAWFTFDAWQEWRHDATL